MLSSIINKELLGHLISAKFAILTVFCLILVFTSVYVSTRDYRLRLEEYRNSISLKQQKARPWDMWKAFREPEAMSIFSQGMDKRLGNMVDVDSFSLRLSGYLGWQESRSSHVFGSSAMDLTFIVRMLLSLFAIFLAYDVVSGEKEAGTLKLTLSHSVPRNTLLLGKFLGGVICLLIPLAMSFIIGLLMVQTEPLVSLGREGYVRLGLILLVSILYLTAFFALGMLVSCRTRNSATTLLILLILWICLLVIVPNASIALAKKLVSIPSREEIDRRLDADGYHSTGDYDEDRRRIIVLEAELFNGMYRQTDIARWISRQSPGAIYSYATDALARTDINSYHRFMRFIRDYSRRYEEFMSKVMNGEEVPNVEEYNAFSATPESLGDSLNAALPDICLLVLLNVLFFMGAYLSFLRYEV
jgi:ABC-type transport system involved in multi-copper enzyme maturation permease subunit